MYYDEKQLELLYDHLQTYHYYYDNNGVECFELIEDILDNTTNKDLVAKVKIIAAEILISDGDFENGFSLYHNQHVIDSQCNIKMWDGKPTNDPVILWYDGGFGDAIHAARYFSTITSKILKPIVMIRKELQQLISQSFPELPLIVSTNVDNSRFEFRIPKGNYLQYDLSKLHYIFSITPDTVPNKVPYLKAKTRDTGHKIGWCWESGVDRSSHFRHLRSIPYIWMNVLMKEFGGISLHPRDLHVNDFAGTAEIINGLDLVITVDTAIAHLAGALGKQVWILLPSPADKKWLRDRTDSPWYPTAKLFRQPKPGDWKSVLNEVQSELLINKNKGTSNGITTSRY